MPGSLLSGFLLLSDTLDLLLYAGKVKSFDRSMWMARYFFKINDIFSFILIFFVLIIVLVRVTMLKG
jgi:hypothetical protein